VKCKERENCTIGGWDGCSKLWEYNVVDVFGLGDVSVPQRIKDSSMILQDWNCRQTPGVRAMAAGAWFDGKLMIAGGKTAIPSRHYRDVWMRDDMFPQAVISSRPKSNTPDSVFIFESNKPGAGVFEYKIVQVDERLDVTPWIKTTSTRGCDVSWLDNKKGGPGKGMYALYVRSIDPSGNKDFRFSTDTNVHVWLYVPPIPWGEISIYTTLFILFSIAVNFEYRRRKRKAALERYAIRKMRRKFKLQAKASTGDVDWREFYAQQKAKQEARRKKAKKKEKKADHKDKEIFLTANDATNLMDGIQNVPEEKSAERKRHSRREGKGARRRKRGESTKRRRRRMEQLNLERQDKKYEHQGKRSRRKRSKSKERKKNM